MTKIQNLKINNSFLKELTADENETNFPRQVYKAAYSFVRPKPPVKASLIIYSKELAAELGIEDPQSSDFLEILSGKSLLPDTKPYAMNYGGHQFGHWAGQLGDGRAINLAQVEVEDKSWTLQLKGAGTTPYSRSADGQAVLRSSVREFLCSEAMHHLGIATTRALSLALSGEQVLRDVLYNGNSEYEKGAIVCRVSPSFIRFGSFELLSARQDYVTLKSLVDYTIKHHYSHLGNPSKNTYLAFFEEVANRTAEMIIHWQRVGFVHGVMNTDNFSILGQTIDYGPYGWLENYDPEWTPNTTDSHQKRYRFGNQGSIALWNLTQLANALYPLIEDVPALEGVLENYRNNFLKKLKTMHLAKLGLLEVKSNIDGFLTDLNLLLVDTEVDMTIFYRSLSNLRENDPFEHLSEVKKATYCSEEIWNFNKEKWKSWLQIYADYLTKEKKSAEERKVEMDAINPKYVLRNYMAQLAIDEADKGNYTLIEELHVLLKKPYDEQPEKQKWFAKRPDWAKNRVGCSQLSCSS